VYSMEFRRRALALLEDGLSAMAVSRLLGVDRNGLASWANDAGMELRKGRHGGLVGRDGEEVAVDIEDGEWLVGGRLTEAARGFIAARRRDKWSCRRIADEIGVVASTISREIKQGTVDATRGYRPRYAHQVSIANQGRPKTRRLADNLRLRAVVVEELNLKFSPEQIAAWLKRSYPDREDMWVSHETIYQALYVQGKGSLRHELTVEKALRTGRTSRRPRSKLPARGNRSWIGPQAHISTRPAEAADRAVPGHWEGDLIIGAGLKSALITLVERASRFTLIRRLPLTHDADTVTRALIEMVQDLPAQLRRTLTWDQGSEMADHADFTIATGCQVFFCDPHSPWQRGTNENTNGLIRDFHPKGTDFTQIPDEEITRTAQLLNIRPRKTLAWDTPAERLQALLEPPRRVRRLRSLGRMESCQGTGHGGIRRS
jgi:transposase, IS30 family